LVLEITVYTVSLHNAGPRRNSFSCAELHTRGAAGRSVSSSEQLTPGTRRPSTAHLFDTAVTALIVLTAGPWLTTAGPRVTAGEPGPLADGQASFYNARYEDAAALTREPCADRQDYAACELRTSALLFELKRSLGDAKDKDQALDACAKCPALMAAFHDSTATGQAAARATLARDPDDEDALFFLGKLDLNYVWLQLGTLGHKTGWNEYWEARRSLDAVLKRNPKHVRAKVARAWIDYIVDTRMPRGTRWVLGGGSRKRALQAMHEAAAMETDFYTSAEARFALWDVEVRERDFPAAVAMARQLSEDFPTNADLTKFRLAHDPEFKLRD
jgi:tetratricopeptide (TPR) repeat protein